MSGRCFGEDSVLYRNLKYLSDHVEDNENEYNYEFRQEKLFDGDLVDKIHYKIQRFFDSCAGGDPSQLNLKKIDFREIMDQIEEGKYYAKVPAWLRKLVKKREGKSLENKGGEGNLSGNKRR